MSYVIQSPSGARVIDPKTMEVRVFAGRDEARAYAAKIKPEMPSKDLPLRVVVQD